MEFEAKKVKDSIVTWIRNWFDKNGSDCKAVIGISGGKDSSIVAALCVEALGDERVVAVLMPQGRQHDIKCSEQLINHLGICDYIVVNIENAVGNIEFAIGENNIILTAQTEINLPARIRMSTLYAVSQSVNGRVANTCNLSEDYVGYSTRYGDSVGDFSPLSDLTVTEVKQIGYELGLPKELVDKTPIDGLCGKTDEENLGFTYEILDRYIRTGACENSEMKNKIDKMHANSRFKMEPMPKFNY